MKSKNNKKGFTLVEIIIVVSILVVVATIFSVNMISTLNKNKEKEEENVITVVKTAAETYIAVNPEKFEDLYEGYGYVDVTIDELIDNGLLNDDIRNQLTEDVVRVTLATGDFLDVTYPIAETDKELTAWSMVAEYLNIDYDSKTNSNTWCNNKSNVYKGLKDANYTNLVNYAAVTSKMYLMDNSARGAQYEGNYFGEEVNLEVSSCNVNPQVAGTYNITYKFKDPALGTEKTVNRPVYVRTSTNDVVKFEAIINNGKHLMINADSTNVPIRITEIYKDGSKKPYDVTISDINSIGYEISGFATNKAGSFTANVKSKKTNSDGSVPKAVKASYLIIDSFVQLLAGSPDCTQSATSGSGCYFRGEQENNYVNYYGKTFRIYYVNGNTSSMKMIYDGDYKTAPYGQIGQCISSGCCNNGRIAYITLGDNTSGFGATMSTHLNEFNNSLGGSNLKYLQSQTFTSYYNEQDYSLRTNSSTYKNLLSVAGNITNNAIKQKTMTTKVSLLQVNEYSNIANCTSESECETETVCTDSTSSKNNCYTGTFCTPKYTCSSKSNYLNKGSNFWLLEFYSVRLGVGAYNAGVSAAEAQEFIVTSDGDISHDGATKAFNSSTVNTSSNGIRPTLQLDNPKVASGDGSKSNPYVIK